MHFSGLLNIDKPPGLTSHDVVAQIRRLLSTQEPAHQNDHQQHRKTRQVSPKVGHTGTLDPFATGILLIAIGSATRLIEYSHAWKKTYHAVFILGASSNTDDATGQISKTDPQSQTSVEPTTKQIQAALRQFIGPIKQVPPAFSAVKIAGERAYKIARRACLSGGLACPVGRQGIHTTLQPRPVTIHSITVTKYNYPELSLTLTCSTGTYIRSLARDLGSVLSVGAYVKDLRRTRIGPHKLTQSINLKDLTIDQLKNALLPPTALISHLPQITLADDNVAQFLQGQPIGEQGTVFATTPPPSFTSAQPSAVFNQTHTFLGIGLYNSSMRALTPHKVLTNALSS